MVFVMTTLISFLGKGQDGRGYRDANYQFDDNQYFEKRKYIGLALAEKIKPSKIIFLGTSGSMWDVFLESESEGLVEQWLELNDAVKSQSVTQKQLQPFEQFLSKALNTEVHCILIPFAKDAQEQIAILSVLANILHDKDQVILDVTHGFRHLPMLALVAARFLKTIKKIDVQHIYYGALEMTEQDKTPVLKLDSLLSMLDWIDALTVFDKDGDYRQFSSLLAQEGLSENDANLLNQAAFFERTTNSSNARQKLNTVRDHLETFDTPIYSLFKQQLLKRLHWVNRANRGLQEQQLAKEYLERKDYLRAVIFAMEGMISSALFKDKLDENSRDNRDEKANNLAGNISFRKLKNLRNTLAHGNRSNDKDALDAVSDEKKMQQSLKDHFKKLLD